MVNGPEDPPRLDLDAVDWDWVDWRSAEGEVRRLRQRIFKAAQEHSGPARPSGLLEPCAAMSGTHGSEGGPAGQPAGPTRRPLQA
jgi:hypothetical protein